MEEKKALEKDTNWVKKITPSASIRKKTWAVLVYRVRVADYPRSVGDTNTKYIEKENKLIYLIIRIKGVR